MSDRVLTTLANEYRRQIIKLLDENGEVRMDNVISFFSNGEGDERHIRAELYHHHLPKLDSVDAVAWTPDNKETIGRGSKFDRVVESLDSVEGVAAR